MFGGVGQRGFVRTRISMLERVLCAGLAGGILAIGAAIYAAGRSYDEALFGLDPAALSGTPARRPAAEPAALAPLAADAAAPRTPASWLAEVALPGWRRYGDIEFFDTDDLYVKINGRAEQYLAYDLVGLTCVSLTGAGDQFIDIYIYDMGTPAGAFGIYSVERDRHAPPVDLGRGGFRSGASLFFWQGSYYVQILASATGTAAMAAADQIAAALVQRLPDHGRPVDGMDLLPAAGRVPGSLRYLMRNGLSLPFLTDTWTADYVIDGRPVTLFVSVQPSADAADGVVDGYRAYLGDMGAILDETRDAGVTTLFGAMDGDYDVVRGQGALVAGAALLPNRELAEHIAAEWLPRLVGEGARGGPHE